MDIKKAYDSVRKEVLCNILIEFGIPMKPVRLINKRLTETHATVRVGRHLYDMFGKSRYFITIVFQFCCSI